MYFTKSNNFFHGVMFHHFHNDKLHKKGQGSISQDDFYKLLKFIGRNNILDADEFLLNSFLLYQPNLFLPQQVLM